MKTDRIRELAGLITEDIREECDALERLGQCVLDTIKVLEKAHGREKADSIVGSYLKHYIR